MPKIIRNVLIFVEVLLVLAVVMLIAGQGELLKSIVLGIWGGIKAIWLWIVGFFIRVSSIPVPFGELMFYTSSLYLSIAIPGYCGPDEKLKIL